jgi:hypothetical protein
MTSAWTNLETMRKNRGLRSKDTVGFPCLHLPRFMQKIFFWLPLVGLWTFLTAIRNHSFTSSMMRFWVVTRCGFVDSYQRFGWTYYGFLQGWKCRQYVSSQRCYVPTSPQWATIQNNNKMDISVAAVISNAVQSLYFFVLRDVKISGTIACRRSKFDNIGSFNISICC